MSLLWPNEIRFSHRRHHRHSLPTCGIHTQQLALNEAMLDTNGWSSCFLRMRREAPQQGQSITYSSDRLLRDNVSQEGMKTSFLCSDRQLHSSSLPSYLLAVRCVLVLVLLIVSTLPTECELLKVGGV